MTNFDIYRLIGKAYCDGLTHGLHKEASIEKSALSPTTLQELFKKVKSLGNVDKSMQTAHRINQRAWGAVNALEHTPVHGGLLNKLKAYRYKRPWTKLLKDTNELSNNSIHSNLKTFIETLDALPGRRRALFAYGDSAKRSLLDLLKS